MEWSNIIAIVFGVVGAILGGVSLYFSRRSALASEVSADASKASAEIARDSSELQREAWMEEKRSRLVWADWQFRWVYDQPDPSLATVTIGLRNEGKATAYGTTVGLYLHATRRFTSSANSSGTFDDVKVRYQRGHTSDVIPPGSVHLFSALVEKADFGEGRSRHITFRIHYRDGLGEHWHNIKLWTGGTWKDSRGLTHSLVSECRDGVLTVNEKAAENLAIPGESELECPEF